MRNRIPSAVVVAVITLLGSVLLPIVINLATGSTAPHVLKPFRKFYWPVTGFATIILVLFAVKDRLTDHTETYITHGMHPKNRANALAQIQRRINERLDKSLSRLARITLNLEASSASIARPQHLMVQPVTGETEEITRQDIGQTFAEMDESLLILGAPGSGKTTSLLELGQELHHRALMNENAAVPVILDLNTWAMRIPVRPAPSTSNEKPGTRPSTRLRPAGNVRWAASLRRVLGRPVATIGQELELRNWLLNELHTLYKIPRRVGESWLQARKLILLLDGLDEMPPNFRYECVKAINKFQDIYNMPSMAVSCRSADYESVREKLILQGAVKIKPLTRQQINLYLEAAGDQLVGVRTALKQDSTLWELVDSPLMLNVMALAYRDRPASEVELGTTVAARRERLIDAYVNEVLIRRRAPVAPYTIGQTTKWLSQIAHCASAPRSSMPLRRSWLGWKMTWRTTAPESRAHLLISAFVPWVVGFSCAGGMAVPLSLRFGFIAGMASTVALLVFECGYVLATKRVRRKKFSRSSAYPILRRNGIVAGMLLGGISLIVITYGLRKAALPQSFVLILMSGAGMIVILAVAFALENVVPPALIEAIYWMAISIALFCSYGVYRWRPSPRDFTSFFAGGAMSALAVFACVLTALAAADIRPENEVAKRRHDWRALLVPTVLTVMTLTSVFFVVPLRISGSLFAISISATISGVAWAVLLGLLLAGICNRFFSLFKPVLSFLDLVPFQLRKFLDYAVDRSLLYRERTGYVFIHAIFQEYFEERYQKFAKSWVYVTYYGTSDERDCG